ncbi:helix-turn-helix transcriptional regulator [Parvularcula sp. LCG005]|uniref:helix-turn-helix transcriptional regulator n=1 Tax=Parvularcula sp. LCG005 TaxID=3078805 RepID=UPI002943B9FD|nr:helix-turn-helix transcriptional regulator [Parvularcula sp. LCG005]WOI54324.1 helix-turn-helix transcriptional regulator [Parvularcula sp. LCG005]
MDSLRDKQMSLVTEAMRATQLKPTPLAERAGIKASTLTKFLHGQTETLRQTTVNKIANFAKLETVKPVGADEPEASLYAGDLGFLREDVEAGTQFKMRVKTRALNLLGIEPDDILVFDRARRARNGDVVCAQKFSHEYGSTETLVRVLRGNFLVTHTTEMTDDVPLFIDDTGLKIMGTLARQIRDRSF